MASVSSSTRLREHVHQRRLATLHDGNSLANRRR
jgi:hypothetical protein